MSEIIILHPRLSPSPLTSILCGNIDIVIEWRHVCYHIFRLFSNHFSGVNVVFSFYVKIEGLNVKQREWQNEKVQKGDE